MLKVKRPKYLYGEVKVSGLGGVGGNIQQITEAFLKGWHLETLRTG